MRYMENNKDVRICFDPQIKKNYKDKTCHSVL
nr:MAG TPA: hypothetical protein [Caudoviricetes sp.]DAP47853.1 MAG TPA: hypothetical protein [Caudoviricetes sp.]